MNPYATQSPTLSTQRSLSTSQLDLLRRPLHRLRSDKSKAVSYPVCSRGASISSELIEMQRNMQVTCHLNLKEGISNLRASYIPDFGYEDPLNFSLDNISVNPSNAATPRQNRKLSSKLGSSRESWKVLANQILLPFAPKYAMMLRTLQDSERKNRERRTLKLAYRNSRSPVCFKSTIKRIATRAPIITSTPASLQPQQSMNSSHISQVPLDPLHEFKTMILHEDSRNSKAQKQKTVKVIEKSVGELQKIGSLKEEMISMKRKQMESQNKIVAIANKLTRQKQPRKTAPSSSVLSQFLVRLESSTPMTRKGSIVTKNIQPKRISFANQVVSEGRPSTGKYSADSPSKSTFYHQSSPGRPDELHELISLVQDKPILTKKEKVQMRIQKSVEKLYPIKSQTPKANKSRNMYFKKEMRQTTAETFTNLMQSSGKMLRISSMATIQPKACEIEPRKLLNYKSEGRCSSLKSLWRGSGNKRKVKLPKIDPEEHERRKERAIESPPRREEARTPPIREVEQTVGGVAIARREMDAEGGRWLRKGRVVASSGLFN